jgi:hypothetical protein
MARKCFIGFDVSRLGFVASGTAAALPVGVSYVSKTSDTTFYNPFEVTPTYSSRSGRNSFGLAFPDFAFGSANFESSSAQPVISVAVTRSSIGSPQEVWVSFDVFIANLGQNFDDPTNYMRAQARYQVFKWGDLSLRLRRVYSYVASPLSYRYEWEAFNGTTSLGTISPPAYTTTSQWAFVRIRARLDSGTSGRFDITIDSTSLNSGGINSVATTPLNDATHLYFCGGFLGAVNSGTIAYFSMDNVIIDDAEFSAGRPTGGTVTLASDNTLTNWSAVGAATVAAALSGAGTARGTGTGATALLNLGSVTTTGWETDLIGFQLVSTGMANLDPLLQRKLMQGISLSGTAYNGTQLQTYLPPMTPSVLNPAYPLDTIFYKGGTTSFTTADITNCKPRLEVVA